MTKKERHELEDLWRERISDLRSSEMTAVAWAKAHDVSPYQVYYWVHRFRQSEERPAASQARFIAVKVEAPKDEAASAPLTVRVGAFSLEVRAGSDMDLLSRVARTLASV